jgi:uncharacterized protein
MRYLLDVNVLLAAIWSKHADHPKAKAWLDNKDVVLCPISELGFLRISCHRRAFNFAMKDARHGLRQFAAQMKASKIADDLEALDSHPQNSEQVTDHYLADLATKHGLKLATLDGNVSHAVVEVIR